MASGSDKRDTDRLAILGDLQAEIMVFEPLLIKEVGQTGVSVETRYPLILNSLHDLRLTLDGTSVVLKGRVVHSHISEVDQDIVTYRSGIEFVEPAERVNSVVAAFIDAIRMKRSGG